MFNAKITISTKTGRRVTGSESDHGNVTHARVNGSYRALCGTEPGRRSDWSSYSTELDYREACTQAWAHNAVTCRKCEKALYKLSER